MFTNFNEQPYRFPLDNNKKKYTRDKKKRVICLFIVIKYNMSLSLTTIAITEPLCHLSLIKQQE